MDVIWECLAGRDHPQCLEPTGATGAGGRRVSGRCQVQNESDDTISDVLNPSEFFMTVADSKVETPDLLGQELLQRVQSLNRQHAHLAQEQVLSSALNARSCCKVLLEPLDRE